MGTTTLKTAGDALNWLLQPGTAVTRECIIDNDGQWMRFNRDTRQFEMHDNNGIIELIDVFEIGGYDLITNDWILGFVDDDGVVRWESKQVTPEMLAKWREITDHTFADLIKLMYEESK